MTIVFYIVLNGQWLNRKGEWVDDERAAKPYHNWEFAILESKKHPGSHVIQRASV